MFPQPNQQSSGFNPYNTAPAANIASAIGSSIANAKPATFGAPTPTPLTAPQQGINFNAIQSGQVNYTPTPAAPSGFKIAVPATIPQKALSSPSSGTVAQIHSAYSQAQQYNALQGAGTVPNYNPNAPIQSAALDAGAPATTAPAAPTPPPNPYAEYAKQLASASQYSPEYLSALERLQAAKQQDMQLQANLLNGNVTGDTLGFAQGTTARAQSYNALNENAAANSLQVQELMRQGNIAGAKALVDAYAPQSVSPGSSLVSPANGGTVFGGSGAYSDYQAQQTYFNLAQTYPDASIPAYNPQLSAQQNLQVAQQAAQQSPSFQSRSTIPVTLPGGGYALVNKNQVAGYRPDGTAIIVSPAQAAQAQGSQQAIASLTKDRADTQAAINAADSNFPLLLQAVKSAGLNTNAPLVNEINQKIANKTSQSAAMAQLNTLIPSLQTEYSRIIARGGSVDDKTRSSAQAIVNGTYTFNQLQAVYNTVKAEGANVVAGYDKEIQSQTNSLNALYNTGSASNSTGNTVGWGDL